MAIVVASTALPISAAQSATISDTPATTKQTIATADLIVSVPKAPVQDVSVPKPATTINAVKKAATVNVLVRDAVVATPAPAAPSATIKTAAWASAVTKQASTPAVTTQKAATTAATTKAPSATTTTKAEPAWKAKARELAAAAAAANQSALQQTAPAPAPVETKATPTSRQDLAAALAAETNAARAAAGLAPLAYRSCGVTESWAMTLAERGSIAHNNLRTVLSGCGGRTTAGENVASGYTTASAANAGLMASASHRENILDPSYKTISVGVAQSARGVYYWVVNFTG